MNAIKTYEPTGLPKLCEGCVHVSVRPYIFLLSCKTGSNITPVCYFYMLLYILGILILYYKVCR